MGLADQLTLARALSVPFVVLLFVWNFPHHDYWATGLFIAAMATDFFDGRIARRRGRTSALGGLLDPIADKVLVLSVLIVLVDRNVFPGWLVAAIVAREFLISGLRHAAIERGVVMHARDLGKFKTWAQAIAAAIGGLSAAPGDTVPHSAALWAGGIALALTWISGLDYARVAPSLLRGRVSASP
jgi:CDP-diacylglycerol--glycerol-3-phosphate 3-phosphatidyltransferase